MVCQVTDIMDTSAILIPDLLLGRDGLEMEIGPGKGRYILSRAAEQPAWGFVAVEVKSRLCRLIEERARKRGLHGVVVFHADARRLLPRVEPTRVFDRVTLNFPDPWWKKRHRKRAVMVPETLDLICDMLVPGGELYVQTDVFERARSLLRTLAEHPSLRNASPSGGLLDGRITRCTSNREQHCIDAGLPVFRMLFTRTADPAEVDSLPT